jgi:hypothetical protein
MQREVQRFIRDIIRIFVEIAAEHFNEKSLLLYSGLSIPEPTPQEIQAKQQYPQMVQQAQMQGQPPPPPPPPTQGEIVRKMFDAVVKIVRADKLRCAAVGIETDSTILPDEQKERQDRMAFLSSMGAFLQQSAPLALQYPDMRGLLGGIMMFTLRTFSASRPLEKEFEEFQKKLAQQPPMPPPGTEDKQGKAEALKAQQQQAQMKTEADKQTAAQSDATKRYEIDQRTNVDKMKAAQDHEYRMAQLQIERDKVQLEKTKLGLQTMAEERDVDTARADKASEQADAMREQMQAAADKDADRADADIDRGLTETLENRKLDLQEDAQAQAAEQAAQEPTGE